MDEKHRNEEYCVLTFASVFLSLVCFQSAWALHQGNGPLTLGAKLKQVPIS